MIGAISTRSIRIVPHEGIDDVLKVSDTNTTGEIVYADLMETTGNGPRYETLSV